MFTLFVAKKKSETVLMHTSWWWSEIFI